MWRPLIVFFCLCGWTWTPVESTIYLTDSFLEYEFPTTLYFDFAETKWPIYETVSSNRVGILPTLNLEELFPEEYGNSTADADVESSNSTTPPLTLDGLLREDDEDDEKPKFLLVDFPTSGRFDDVISNVSTAATKMRVDFVVMIVHKSTPWKEKFAFFWSQRFPGTEDNDYWRLDRMTNEGVDNPRPHYFMALNNEQGSQLLELVRGLIEQNVLYESLYNETNASFAFGVDDLNAISGFQFVTRVGLYFIAMLLMSRYMGDENNNGRPLRQAYNRYTGEDLCLGEINASSPEQECPICLETMLPGDAVRILPCRHILHTECINGWFEQAQYTCPMCKMELSEHMEEQRQAATEMNDSTQRRGSWIWPFGRNISSMNRAQLISTVDEDFDGDLELTEESSAGVLA